MYGNILAGVSFQANEDLVRAYSATQDKEERSEIAVCMAIKYEHIYRETLLKHDLSSQYDIQKMKKLSFNNVPAIQISILEILFLTKCTSLLKHLKNITAYLPCERINCLNLSFKNLSEYLLSKGFKKINMGNHDLFDSLLTKFDIKNDNAEYKSVTDIYHKLNFWEKNYVIFCLILLDDPTIEQIPTREINLNHVVDLTKDNWLLSLIGFKIEKSEKFELTTAQLLLLNCKLDAYIKKLKVKNTMVIFRIEMLRKCIFKPEEVSRQTLEPFANISDNDLAIINSVSGFKKKRTIRMLNSIDSEDILKIILNLHNSGNQSIIEKISYKKPEQMITKILEPSIENYFKATNNSTITLGMLTDSSFNWPNKKTLNKVIKLFDYHIDEPSQGSFLEIISVMKDFTINFLNVAGNDLVQNFFKQSDNDDLEDKIILNKLVVQLKILVLKFPSILTNSTFRGYELMGNSKNFPINFPIIYYETFNQLLKELSDITAYAKKHKVEGFLSLALFADTWSYCNFRFTLLTDKPISLHDKLKEFMQYINKNPRYLEEKKVSLINSLESLFPKQMADVVKESKAENDIFGPFYDINKKDLMVIRDTMNNRSLTIGDLNSLSSLEIMKLVHILHSNGKQEIISKLSYEKPLQLIKSILASALSNYYCEEKKFITTSSVLIDPEFVWPTDQQISRIIDYFEFHIFESAEKPVKLDKTLLNKANKILRKQMPNFKIKSSKDIVNCIVGCLHKGIQLPRLFFQLVYSQPRVTSLEASLCAFAKNFLLYEGTDALEIFFRYVRRISDDFKVVKEHIIDQLTILVFRSPEIIANSSLTFASLSENYDKFSGIYLDLYARIRFERFRVVDPNKQLFKYATEHKIDNFLSLNNVADAWLSEYLELKMPNKNLEQKIAVMKGTVQEREDKKDLLASLAAFFPEFM